MVTINSNFRPIPSPESICTLIAVGPAAKPRIIYQVPSPMRSWGIYALVATAVAVVFFMIVRNIYLNSRRPGNSSPPPAPSAPPISSASSTTAATPIGADTFLPASLPSAATASQPTLPVSVSPDQRGHNSAPPSPLHDRVSLSPRRKSDSDLPNHVQPPISAAAPAVSSPSQDIPPHSPRAVPPPVPDTINATQLALQPQPSAAAGNAALITSHLGQPVAPAAASNDASQKVEPLSDSMLGRDFGLIPAAAPAPEPSYLAQFYQQIQEQISYYSAMRDRFWQKSKSAYDHLFGRYPDDPSKLQKYFVSVAEVRRNYGEQELSADNAEIQSLPSSPFVDACKDLIEILTKPHGNHRTQSVQFVMALRDAADADNSAHPTGVCSRIVGKLSYLRFTSVQIFSYLRELVNLATQGTLPNSPTLSEFLPHFLRCNDLANHIPKKHGVSKADSAGQKLEGHFNWADFLKDRNVPYVDGMMILNGRTITVLRHGVPIAQYEKIAIVVRGVCKVWEWLTSVRIDPRKYYKASEQPKMTADYLKCVNYAALQNQKFLQLVLENGDMKIDGDESGRFNLRLTLNELLNVFALAFRMDGEFFEKHIDHETFDSLKKRFKEQLLGFTQETFYHVPEKVRIQTELLQDIDRLLDEVKSLYFPHISTIENIDTHQAFLMLSYAHITLYLCQRLGISFLEAFCKDDIDRGRVFKTILWLHFLYLTNQITSDNLIKVLVLTLAAPISVKKQGVISSRVKHLVRTVPFIVKAHERVCVPQKMVAGRDLGETRFEVVERPNQGFQAVAAS